MDMIVATAPVLLIRKLSISRSTKLGLCLMMGGGWLYVHHCSQRLDHKLISGLQFGTSVLLQQPSSKSTISKDCPTMPTSRFPGLQ